ncbi:hypothetical protein ABFS82_08G034400 [Erythranthe guttata]
MMIHAVAIPFQPVPVPATLSRRSDCVLPVSQRSVLLPNPERRVPFPFRYGAVQHGESKKKQIAKAFTRPYEDIVAADIINPDNVDVDFDSIGGLDEFKKELYELVILPLRRPELFSHGKLVTPQRGILLYGPPGTGKTMLAKAIAKESGAVFINLRISSLKSQWLGESEKQVAAVFSLAHKRQPSIIFIDEAESFLGQRKSDDQDVNNAMKTIFMSMWDGFNTDKNSRVMVLACTNRPSDLDEAILRRLPRSFEIGMPDLKARVAILKTILKGEKVDHGIDHDYICGLCDGYSGSDIFELCKKAVYLPIRDFLDDEKAGKPSDNGVRPLSQLDLEKAIATTTNTIVAAAQYTKKRNSNLQSLYP